MDQPPIPPARHPMRRGLAVEPLPDASREDQDLKLFVLSFTAFFICFYSFIM
jgi:hypothetical protein